MRGSLLLPAALVAITVGAGCARPTNPWVYAEPPAVSVVNTSTPVQSGKTVIAIANFENPDLPQLNWPDVGSEMTRALRRTLFAEGDYEVRIAPEIERLASQPGFLKKKGADPDDKPVVVDFVVTGKITDFHHTAALPKDVSRWGIFVRRSEAVVAIHWLVVDVRAHRVLATDHTYGTAKASRKKEVAEQYAGIDCSTYLFWNTPLGRAAHSAIDETIDRLHEVVPTHVGDPVIVNMLAARKVAVKGGWSWGIAQGQQYYLVARDDQGTTRGFYDADTGRPLMVKIGDVKPDTSTAWLMGKPADGIDLSGAALARKPAPPSDADLARRAALDDDA